MTVTVSGTTASLVKEIHILLHSVFLIIQVSFDLAEYTANVDAVGTLRLLDAIKTCGMENTVRFYQVHAKQIISSVIIIIII